MLAYHDHEWGVPSHDDRHLFEMLVLEGAQAGLSWATVLARREHYRRALDGFDAERVAAYDQRRLAELLADPGLIRNRLKISSLVKNARAVLEIRSQRGSFAAYLWGWVDGRPVVNRPRTAGEVESRSELSDRISKDLEHRGCSFVGPTIVYSYLQAVGVIDDHLTGCPAKRG